ncbi:YhcH/YjgK/YiaL family protein [Planctomycetota bacterium]|nr:YhcH/YjgK/YiaL family protein [Planctomycetota bacterium]
MIVDKLENAGRYGILFEGLRKGFAFLRTMDVSKLEAGRNKLAGEDFANFDTYMTRDEDEGRWEVHEKYVDIQYMVEGEEEMRVCELDEVEVEEAYDEEKDIAFYEGECRGSCVKVKAGEFVVFMPGEVHMPCMAIGEKRENKKVVVKVRVG